MPQENDVELIEAGPSGRRQRGRWGALGGAGCLLAALSGIIGPRLAWSALAIALSAAYEPSARAATKDVPQDMESAAVDLAEAERALAKDPRRAIELYERGLAQIPQGPGYAPVRVEVLLTIVDAHAAAFAEDGRIERLRRARELLDRYLGPLDLLDEQGRASAEERRIGLLERIAAVEARMRAEARVREAAAARDRGRRLTSAGIGTLAGAVVGFGVMGLGVRGGKETDDALDSLLTVKEWETPCAVGDAACRDERIEEIRPLIDAGSANNAMVLGGAIVGGVLASTGIVLIVFGRKSVRRAAAIDLTPTAAGAGLSLGLALRGRF